jgi:hypothetical protein
MTDDERPPTCSAHHWSARLPVWIWNAAGELVEHPTAHVRVCVGCNAEESVEEETQP